eukprot:UN27344
MMRRFYSTTFKNRTNVERFIYRNSKYVKVKDGAPISGLDVFCTSDTDKLDISDILKEEIKNRKFKPKGGKSISSRISTDKSEGVIGLDEKTPDWYEVGSTFARLAETTRNSTASLYLNGLDLPDAGKNVEDIVTGSQLALHKDKRFKGSKKDNNEDEDEDR